MLGYFKKPRKIVPCYNVIQKRIRAEFTIAVQVAMFIEYKYLHRTKDRYNSELKNRHYACKHMTCTSMLKVTLYKTIIIYTTIRILAGIRPCGIIVLIAELFTAESKSQVYSHLHEFFKD